MAYQTDAMQKFHEVLTRFDTGMLITHGGNHRLHGRPMAVAQVEATGDVWFLTSYNSPKMDEIRANDEVMITFQNKRDEFVTLVGRARPVRDTQKIEELWRESFKVWFPEGKADPDIVLLRVEAEQGEYWDNSGLNKVIYLADALRAYVTGETPDVAENRGLHGKVQF